MIVKEHTILFTEECPLDCRYCFIKDDDKYKKNPSLNKEKILKRISEIDLSDDRKKVKSILLLTGGEPFLYPKLIKEIILQYGNRFSYKFNTSGYLLTKEMIEFLSHYDVSFVLSVDGDEKLTNYLRPVKSNKYRTGYFKRFKEIVPYLLYYFPDTPFKMIISPRYVDSIYNIYLISEQLGFRFFKIILDFETRTYGKACKKQNRLIWTDEKIAILKEQIFQIIKEQLLGFSLGIQKPEIIEVNNVLKYLAISNNKFSPDNYPCKVFNGRTLVSVQSEEPNFCMSQMFQDIQTCKEKIMEEFRLFEGKCKKDQNCPAFNFCCQNSCPKDNYDENKSFFKIETLTCILNRVCYEAALAILYVGQDICKDSELFKLYLKRRGFGGGVCGGC